MSTEDANARALYSALLRRPPNEQEVQSYRTATNEARSLEAHVLSILSSYEFKHKQGVYTVYPPGHWYSPVVDPSRVRKYVDWSARSELSGISIDQNAMQEFYQKHLALLRSSKFPVTADERFRYYSGSGFFPFGDALVLRAIMAEFRPRQIIEIGSGFSTAAMLDFSDELNLSTKITCVEPYPDRLKSLLRPKDYDRVAIMESDLQVVPLSTFDQLSAGDVLFIDSTHVLKTGSDVHYELFHILPRLAEGVMIHIHDVQYPFEYPNQWIFELNRSWNEIYAVRAFLMYNRRFSIFAWNDYFRRVHTPWFQQNLPEAMVENPGGSIWLKVERDLPV